MSLIKTLNGTSNNVISTFFIAINKIKPRIEEEPIPELVSVHAPDPLHSNPKVAEWIAQVKKNEAARK